MVFKYNFSISGDDFYPEKIINDIKGNFNIDTYFNPKDKKYSAKTDEYGYGEMSFWHPKKFSTEDNIYEYEKSFIEFIGENYTMFIENGVVDLQIFMEIFFDGEQCNFEIFDRDTLKKITKSNISLPISIYILNKEKIENWEEEIRAIWEV